MLKQLLKNLDPFSLLENFKRIQDLADQNVFLRNDFFFRTYTFPLAVTNFNVPHGLKFTPKDLILLSITGAGTLTVNYAQFSAQNLNFTTSGACVVRILVGSVDG